MRSPTEHHGCRAAVHAGKQVVEEDGEKMAAGPAIWRKKADGRGPAAAVGYRPAFTMMADRAFRNWCTAG